MTETPDDSLDNDDNLRRARYEASPARPYHYRYHYHCPATSRTGRAQMMVPLRL